jgi:amino acid adenylation domain-containing protein
MNVPSHLSQLLDEAAEISPSTTAVEDEQGRQLSYRDLYQAADRLAARLVRWGVGRGDRVGLFLPKSVESVAAIHGILRTGAAYVPVDPTAPPSRGAGSFADCGVRAVVISAELAPKLREAWPGPGPLPRMVIVGEGAGVCDASWTSVVDDDAPSPSRPQYRTNDLAYILYTSGSTGHPKGVMLTHTNAFCFLDWCDATLDLRNGERYSSHAPFHFDLSIFDLFACCRRGGTLVLIGESLGRDVARLGAFLDRAKIDVWYSAPSILALLTTHAKIDRPEFPAPRIVLFAGEVFPIPALKRLRSAWPESAMWNLYGPTETNVCTAQEIPSIIPEDRTEPYPIGRVCEPLKALVLNENGHPSLAGELLISGPGVMHGYFDRSDLTDQAFLIDEQGVRWYRTGDLVDDDGTGSYTFRGRRDRMVKKRGYRIELGEIEAALHRHEDVESAAVVASDSDEGTSISAFIVIKPDRKTSIIAIKRYCMTCLPTYMIPDRIEFVAEMPRTSTDKVDYQGLARLAGLWVKSSV